MNLQFRCEATNDVPARNSTGAVNVECYLRRIFPAILNLPR